MELETVTEVVNTVTEVIEYSMDTSTLEELLLQTNAYMHMILVLMVVGVIYILCKNAYRFFDIFFK